MCIGSELSTWMTLSTESSCAASATNLAAVCGQDDQVDLAFREFGSAGDTFCRALNQRLSIMFGNQ